MSRIYDQTILDGIVNKVLKSSAELERTIEHVSIQDACEALQAETLPVDVEVSESKRSPWLDLAAHICVDPFRRKP